MNDIKRYEWINTKYLSNRFSLNIQVFKFKNVVSLLRKYAHCVNVLDLILRSVLKEGDPKAQLWEKICLHAQLCLYVYSSTYICFKIIFSVSYENEKLNNIIILSVLGQLYQFQIIKLNACYMACGLI